MTRIFFALDSDNLAGAGRFSARALRHRTQSLLRAARALSVYRADLAGALHFCGSDYFAQATCEDLRRQLNLSAFAVHVAPCFSPNGAGFASEEWNGDKAISPHAASRTHALEAWFASLRSSAFIVGDQYAARYLIRRVANWALPAIFRLDLQADTPCIISPKGLALLHAPAVGPPPAT